jgi:L-asparaginase/Glu-tRNA(Gln) amidotransferase subunit D
MQRMSLPCIRLLLGPGTLHSRGADRMDFTRYSRSGNPRMTGDELLATLPEIERIACVEVDDGNPHAVASLEDLRKLSVHANELLRRPGLDGLVLVQGTNQLEETAYFLNLTVRSAKPVVITGAQRPYTALSADGPVNLLDAVRVAAAQATRGRGRSSSRTARSMPRAKSPRRTPIACTRFAAVTWGSSATRTPTQSCTTARRPAGTRWRASSILAP